MLVWNVLVIIGRHERIYLTVVVPLQASVPFWYKKGWWSYREQASEQHSSMVSALVPATRFLPWVPALASPVDWTITNKPIKYAPPQVTIGYGIYHSNREQTRTANKREDHTVSKYCLESKSVRSAEGAPIRKHEGGKEMKPVLQRRQGSSRGQEFSSSFLKEKQNESIRKERDQKIAARVIIINLKWEGIRWHD